MKDFIAKTAIERKVEEMSIRLGISSNNLPYNELANPVETIIEEVEKLGIVTFNEWIEILNNNTRFLMNPEWSAVRAFAADEIKLMGGSINENYVQL